MKKKLFLIAALCSFFTFDSVAQSTSQGINFQALVKDSAGKPVLNTTVNIQISLTSENSTDQYYTEVHQISTDFLGQINLVIGQGTPQKGSFKDVPWSKEQIVLDLNLLGEKSKDLKINTRTKLLSVPYAFYATTTSKVTETSPDEKNQSIYWTTGGNTATRPPTHFLGTRDAQDLVIKTNDQERLNFTKGGQFKIKSGVDGPDTDKASYPVVIEGSTQGIYIKINGSRNNSNNFVTFADDIDVWGRIEGQTIPELEQTWQYKLQVSQFAFQGVALAGQIAAWTAKGIGEGFSLFGAGASVGSWAQVANLIFQASSLLTQSIGWGVNIRTYIGVAYVSGAGDYAEWLPRKAGERDLHFGEIVGIRGGVVSLNTNEADHIMVVSMRPAVIGNTPEPGQESQYEKIAFLGQVPIKVVGAVTSGDYIIASGNHDGVGIAIHPEQMKTGDYARVVGVAWESAPEQPINFVNVAVGINVNDLNHKIDLLNREVENIMAFLEGKAPLLEGDQIAALTPPSIQPQTTFQKLYTDEEFDAYIDQHELFLKGLFTLIKSNLVKQGTDLSIYPQVEEMLDNPVPFMKSIRRDPTFITQWALVDQNFKNSKLKK